MLRTRLAAGITATALVGSLGFAAAAPASAKGQETTVIFANSAVKGLKVTAVKPGTGKGKKFTFPAKVKGLDVTHKGGLVLTNTSTGQSLKIINIAVDLEAGTATVDAPDLGLDKFGAFDVANVKANKKKVTAKLNVAAGVAAALNGVLGTKFKDGQTIASTETK